MSSEYNVCWIVSRTWSVRSKTSIGSSAAPGPRSAVSTGAPNSMIHLLGNGISPSGPSNGQVGRDRRVGRPEQPGHGLHVADDRVDLLGADDGARDDRRAGAQGSRDEPATAEPLELVALAERLADPLEALGPDAAQLAVGEQPLGVGVGGERGARLAGDLTDHRRLEHQVRPEHAQVPVGRVLVVDGHLGHQGVHRDRAGVVGHDEATTGRRDVVDATHLDPEPRAVERAQHGEVEVPGEVLVEAELVHGVVAGDAATDVGQHRGEVPLDVVG